MANSYWLKKKLKWFMELMFRLHPITKLKPKQYES